MAIQLNYLLDKGGVKVNRRRHVRGRCRARSSEAVTDLTRDIMTMQAEGDYAAAKAMLDKLGVIRPEAQKVIDRLKDVPVDIEPRFVTADKLTAS